MNKRASARALPLLCASVIVAGFWLGCADESPQKDAAQGCSLSSECKSPLVCAFAKCRQACKATRDCSPGERCVQSDKPSYICQKQGCSRNSDCLGTQICAVDAQCRDQCLTQKDCLVDQVCSAGACADVNELVGGALPNVHPDAGLGQRCTLPSDCPGDFVCLRDGICGAECIIDKDCPRTYACTPVHPGGPGRCFPPSAGNDGGSDPDAADTGSDASVSDASDGGSTQLRASPISAGSVHTCVWQKPGTIKCWGGNGYGQLGYGDTAARGDGPNEMGDNLPFVALGTGRTAKSVSALEYSTCAILDNDRVKCWGFNSEGQLGSGNSLNRGDAPNQMGDNLPYVDLGTGRTAKALGTGYLSACAILDNDKVKCWGWNQWGQLGIGDMTNRGDNPNQMGDNLPYVDLGTARTAKAISMGAHSTCAILDNDKVKCWGRNDLGQLGLGDTTQRGSAPNEMGDNLPYVDLGTGRTAKALTLGYLSACALLDNAQVKCWGWNGSGALGYGDAVSRGAAPGQMGDNLPYVSLGAGRTVKMLGAGLLPSVILDTNQVKSWGDNAVGQLGLGDTTTRGNAPNQMGDNLPSVDLGVGRTAVELTRGFQSGCAILDNDKIRCWGANNVGQLGYGDMTPRGAGPNQMGDNLPYVKLVGP